MCSRTNLGVSDNVPSSKMAPDTGFAAWMTGSGVAAQVALEQAAACDPAHRMTQLVGQMLQARTIPAGMATDARADPSPAARRAAGRDSDRKHRRVKTR